MARRILGLAMILGAWVLGLAGCEGLRHGIRSTHDDQAHSVKRDHEPSQISAVESDTSKIQAVDSDEKKPQPFFKSNRKPGTWSSEAQEIEGHFGVK